MALSVGFPMMGGKHMRGDTGPGSSNLPQRLRNVRTALGVTQRELAKLLQVSPGAVGLWEAGKRPISGPAALLLETYEEELGFSGAKGHRPFRTGRLARTAAAGRTGLELLSGAGIEMVLKVVSGAGAQNRIGASIREAVARRAVDSLGELKGLSMKIGQMASYMDFLVSAPTREILQQLQFASPPIPPDEAAGVLVDSFGRTPAELFASWEPYPAVAASVGQVHRAVLRSGEAVAVKIQYPGIREAMASDLENAGILDQVARLMFRGQEPGALVAEIRERSLEECDYALEARRQEEFRALYRDDPRIVVPRVYRELSSPTVLTSEWIEGVGFQDFVAKATEEERNRAGETIFDFVLRSVFWHQRFNGDPHPGNFLFLDGKVACLDFGCVKVLPKEFTDTWGSYVRATLLGEVERSRERFLRMGIVTDPEHYDWEYHRHMVEVLYRSGLTDEPFTFTPEYVEKIWRALVDDNSNRTRVGLSRDWVFFAQRVQWGLFTMLASLRATSRWRERYLEATK